MRKAIAVIVGLIALAICAVAVVVRMGDGPLGPFPGGPLIGELVTGPVSDWGFLGSVDRVELQVHPPDPRSITVWIFTHEGVPYVPAAFASTKRWPEETVRDGRVVLRVDQRLYERVAVRVDDPTERSGALSSAQRKYDLDDNDALWLFRLDSR